MSGSGGRKVTSLPASRFADYFVICGLDYNSGLEVLQSYEADGTSELGNCTPLERSYKPKILAHYPENVSWNPFDNDAVRNLCLPSGLIFRTQKHGLDPCFHSFIITRENGSRTFGFSYVFFEEVKSKHVTGAIQTLQAMHLTELSSAKSYQERRATQNKNIRNGSGALHHSTGTGQRRRGQYLTCAEDNNTRSLPRHFKLAAHKQNSLTTVQSFYDASKDKLYVTKAIALICPLPYVQVARSFLIGLYSLTEYGNGDYSIESYVHNLLFAVPLPPPGRSVKFHCFGEKLVYARPKSNELPLLDYCLADLFRLLDLQAVLQLFTCLLLENQILLYSKDLYRLMVVAECMTGVLFPFLWEHVYVPILPSTLHHFLDAPVPFVMGLHAQATECKDFIPCEANLCFVDIDNSVVQVPEDLPTFPQRAELIQELADLLTTYKVNIRTFHKCGRNGTSPYRIRRVRGRKSSHGSWSHDSDSGMSSNEESLSLNGSHLNISTQYHSLNDAVQSTNQSETILTLLSVSKKNEIGETIEVGDSYKDEQFLQNLKLNNAIREIFFNRFVHIFSSYDHFVIQPDQDPGRILVHNFDKATFLSDQPDQNLPFLSRFLETQMFATLIDRKIASMSGEVDPSLNLFEQRIKILRSKYGESLVRTPSYEPCLTIRETEEIIEKRFLNPDFTVPFPQEVSSEEGTFLPKSSFPILNKAILNVNPAETRMGKLLREGNRSEVIMKDMSISSTNGDYSSIRSVFVPTETSSSPASIAQANWEFVKQLLQECKSKTKRMLVEKMGAEAVALGHGEVSIVGVEENTLVASLCDLLERIWAHGLHVKQKGRSPLWNFLSNYEESEASKDTNKPLDPQFLSPALAWCILRKRLDSLSARAMELNLNMNSSPSAGGTENSRKSPEKRENRSRSRIIELPTLRPLPVSIASDMRNIQGITEIKTEIGYARAWIRLSLEKKVLSKHLRALLSDDELLRGFYKRTSFLRSEEEREQFLYHLLTLNAVDYFCFTNTYTNIVLPYRVLIFPSRRLTTTANMWVTVSGTLGETGVVPVPKNSLDLLFQHKNLGLLLSLRIGHDNSGVSPKIMVDHVIVRNELTGLSTKFPCSHWLGRDVEDGSTERLLVGEPYCDGEEVPDQNRLRTPPRARSPSVPRRSFDTRGSVPDIQDFLGNALNNIVKYHNKTDRDKGSLTVLLCGEIGLVAALEQVFQYGFKSSRLFTRNFYIWDYFLRVMEFCESELSEELLGVSASDEGEWSEQVESMRTYIELTQKIQSCAESLGKDGKFQLLICLCAREHLLHRLPAQLSSCPVTADMYEKQSFLRDPHLLSYLVQVLEPLDDVDILLENSLSKGID